MSDYRIQIGTELNTKGIDTTLKKYQGKLIEIKSKLNTSGIDKKLASYKAKKPIEVNAKLNTTGLAKKIGEYKPKTPIKLNAKLDTKNINAAISNYKAKKAIELNVKLNHSAISQQIKNYKAKNSITLNTKLNNSEITRQIKSYKAKTPINLSVKLTTKDIDEKIRTYKAKTSIKLDAKINKESINEQIKTFKPRSTIYLKAKLKKGEIAEEIRNYKPGTPVAITADFKVGRTQDVDTKITSYKNTPVDVPVRLMPAKTGFSDKITNKPVKISTTIDKNNIKKDIETAISGYTPTARMPVNIKLTMPKNINSQVTGLGKPTESINVGIELDKDKINADIALFKPTATLGIQPDLILENVDDQIRAYIPKAKIRVNAELNNSDIQALTAKNTDSAYNTVSGGSYIPNATQNLKEVDITIKATKNQITNLGKALKAVGFNNSSVKSITNDFKELGVTVTKVTSKLNSDGSVRLTVKGLDQFKDAVTYVNNIGSDGKLGAWSETVSRDANRVTENFNRLKSIAKDIGNLKIDIFKSDDVNEVKRMTDELNRLQKEYNELFAGTQGGLNGNQINQLNNIANNAESALSKLKKKYAETRAELAKGIKSNFSGYDAEVQILVEKFGMLSAEMPNVEVAISRVKQALADMRAAAKAGNDNALIEAEQRYQDELKETAALLKQNQSIERQGDYNETFAAKKEAAQIKLNGLFEKGSQAAKKYGAEVKRLNEELNNAGSLSAQKIIEQKIANLDKKIKAEGLQRKTWNTRLKEQLSKYTQYLSIASVFIYGIQTLRNMFEQVKAVDTAMIELKKVTDETSASYDIFLKNAATRAKEIGTTIDGLVTSTADFARLGYGFKDAQGLAEVANIYAVVGDEIENVEDASQSLISTMAAFKDEMNGLSDSDFALSIVDKFNEVSNNFSISSGGIGEALTRSASSLAAANNTLDESIALITAANTVVQDPAAVGTAFKTISMRIRGAKTELEDAGLETEGMVESTSKLREEILALSGVDIMASATEFKSTYQILDELADKWQNLTDIQQASITELIAGKRQGNIISSIMANFDIARKVLETSAGSAGSAMAEHEKYMNSIEAKLSQLKASWQSFAQTFMTSEFLKGSIDVLKVLLDLLEKLVDTFGTLGTIGLGVGITKIFKNLKNIKSFFSLSKEVGGITKAFSQLGGVASLSFSQIAGGIGIAVAAFGLIHNAIKKHKEEISEARQETIRASDEFLDAAGSFEQAYIKYSGRADLTESEEAELESAIHGTVNALGDKSSALQGVVNSSNDYLDALERITQEELKAAAAAAKNKRDDAELELKDTVKGWSSIDGSEVNVTITSGTNAEDKGVAKIAKRVGGDFYSTELSGSGASTSVEFIISPNADINEIIDYYDMLLEYQSELSKAGLKNTSAYKNTTKVINTLSETMEVYIGGVYEAVKAEYQLANGIPKTTEEYLKMREDILKSEDIKNKSLDTKMSILNSLDSEYANVFDLSSAEVQARKFIGIIKGYNHGTKDGTDEVRTVETFLNMRTAVNNNECTVGQYLSELDKVKSMSENFSDEEQEAFNLAFSIDSDTIKQQYEKVYNYISRNYLEKLSTATSTFDAYNYIGNYPGKPDASNMSSFDTAEYKAHEEEKIRDILNGLSATELQAVVNIKAEIDWETADADKILAQIKKESDYIEAMNYTIAIDVETENLDKLNSILAESVSASGLSSESIEVLKARYAELASQGYDLSAMFEETSNGIHLNKAAISEFEQTLASQKLSETDDKLETLKNRYDELTEKIENCTDASEKAHLYSEQQKIVRKINDLATLTSQYEGLTSAYNAWQNAESAGKERDMYENVIEGFENVGDEISRGWYDDGTIKFLELITGQTDLASKSASELKEIWNSLDDTIKDTSYSVKDFFTTDGKGNSTSTGAYNFLRAVEELGKNGGLKALEGKNIDDLIVRNDKGNIVEFDFSVVGGDKAVADALGISEEMVQIIQRTLDDAGFVVTLDGKYTLLADLQTSAEKANDKLKKLKSEGLEGLKDVDLNFDFSVDTLDGYQKQFEKALTVLDKFRDENGKLKTDENGNFVEGAQEALEIAEYYTAAMDKLTEPKFMQIDVTEVDEELQEPIEKMQEIGDLCKEKHLISLTGDTEGLDEVQEKINEVAKEIEELDPEIKAQVGIDDDWDAKTIADKIEKGEIEIPAELKLDVQMSEDLKDMRLMMMNQLGLVGDEEVKLKIGYDIDESTVDDLTPDEQKVLVEFIAENEDEFNTLTDEEKEVVIDIVTDDSALKALEEHGVEIEAFAKIFGVEKVDDLKKKLDGLTDKQILVLTEVLGRVDVEKLKSTMAGLDDKTVQAIAEALGKGDVDGLKTTINGLDDKTVQAIAQAFGYKSVEDLNNAIDNLDSKTVQAIAQALGITDVNSLKAAIDRLTDKNVSAVANVDGTDDVNGLKSAIDNLKDKSVTVWAQIKKKASDLWGKLTGGGGVDGTAHIDGTASSRGTTVKKSGKAYKQGDWGTKDSGVALGGELGPELLVRNGKWHLIGENGAEFFGYRKDDIIFSADQTKEIFEKGKITHGNGRGKALVSGTAFSKGTGGGEEPSRNIITGQSYGSSSSDSKDKDFEETLDWIETKISRIERVIDELDQKAGNIYKSWTSRNKALSEQISKVKDEIIIQQKAYDKYMSAASNVGLSSSYAEKVRNGKIDIETIEDETLEEKIKDYQEYYEKALDCKDAIEELRKTEASLFAQRVENASKEYDGILGVIEHEKNMLDEYISQSEAQGWLVSANYYNALASNEQKTIAQLKKKKASMLDELQAAMESGTIAVKSESWYEMVNSIDEVTLAIAKSETQLKEYAQTIQQSSWETFDLLQDKISSVTSETEFLIDLMSNAKLYDDKGQLTDEGKATMGLHGVAYNTYMYQADKTAKEAEKLKNQLSKDPYDTDLEERYREMISLQQEYILNAQNEKEAIKDLVSDGIEAELDALQKLIDKKNEQLQSEKDLYDYQKRVKSQVEEISSLEKQLAAYANDDSSEAMAKKQQISTDLETAREDLQETEFDKLVDDTSAILDELYSEYEELLNTRLDNLDALVSDMITEINTDASSISSTISEKADSVGYTLTDSMKTIWSESSKGTQNVVTTYGEKFTSAQTTTNNALSTINTNLQNMIAQLNKLAKTDVKSASISSAANSKEANAAKNEAEPTTTNKTNTSTSTATKNITVGGKINAGSAKIYSYVGDTSGERQYYRNDPIYNVLKTSGNWLQVRWHKLSKGITGWFKKDDVKAYSTGKKNFLGDEIAWTQDGGEEFIIRPSDGAILTPVAKGDSILTSAASNNIWDMANSPSEFIKDNLNIGVANVPNNSNVNNTYTQNFENVVFSMPNVKNYEQLISEMQRDPKFEKLVLAMTVNQIAGKSKLAKNKTIR